MQNGYAVPSAEGLKVACQHLRSLDKAGLDVLRARLGVGVGRGREVAAGALPGPNGSPAVWAALPITYARLPRTANWRPFASLVLEAAYEATLLEAVLNTRRGASNTLLLTRLGGGVFGNDDRWIDAALVRALQLTQRYDLDVRLVSYGVVPDTMRVLAAQWTAAADH